MYILITENGPTTPLNAWQVRCWACTMQSNARLRPDHPDDVDLVLAIQLLQEHGVDVRPAGLTVPHPGDVAEGIPTR